MALTVTFLSGVDEITVQGLTQWDKGQQIEIHCSDLPTVFQMHFTCKHRTEAIVVSGTMSDGVGTVAIPDALLEQATDLKAWVYVIGTGTGETVKTINLPIVPRTKPEDYVTSLEPTQQTQLDTMVAGVNSAVDDIEAGIDIFESTVNSAISTFETTVNNDIDTFEAAVNAEILPLKTDYIVEQSTTPQSFWTYRKWNSGLYEGWLKLTPTEDVTFSVYNNVAITGSVDFPMPPNVEFSSIREISAVINSIGREMWCGAIDSVYDAEQEQNVLRAEFVCCEAGTFTIDNVRIKIVGIVSTS